MFRPQKVKTFEPKNPEYLIADSLTAEMIEATSPLILWWSFAQADTISKQDELDHIYGEASTQDGKFVFTLKPSIVHLRTEFNPILKELTRLGVEQIESLTVYANISEFIEENGSNPKSGDVFRLSYIEKEQKFRNIYYTVSVVVPVDLFNLKYLNWQIYCEQTPLDSVPQYIQDYKTLL